MTGAHRPTRRAVLLGGLALVASACRLHRSARTAPAQDEAALRAAAADELSILAGYDAVIAAHRPLRPFLRTERSAHEQHLAVLQSQLATSSPAPTASTSTSPTAPPRNDEGLRRELTRSAARLSAAAVAAADGEVAALLASVGASHDALGQRAIVSVAGSVSPSSGASH